MSDVDLRTGACVRPKVESSISSGGKHVEALIILGMKVSTTSYPHALEAISRWAGLGASKYVCVATVNNVMEAHDCRAFQTVMNQADLVTPDGMPLVWGSKLLGHTQATRVYGPDLMPMVLDLAAANGIPIGLYGGAPEVLAKLTTTIRECYPSIQIAYSCSPPFRPLTPDEDQVVVETINSSGARILFVGLNTPKQDYWMSAHRGRIQTVMLGVGAAFDFLAGTKPQAPRWMMRVGFEWLFRLATEPRRLWKRYLKHNPRFVALFTLQLLGLKRFDTAL